MRRARGLTVVEVLIALAVIAVAFAALAYAQLTSLKASSRSRLTSQAKTVAENVLENQLKQVLKVDTSSSISGTAYNDGSSTNPKEFYFVDYYYGCPSPAEPIQHPTGTRSAVNSAVIQCTGTVQRTVQDGTVKATWTIDGESGPLGEGVVDITVTAKHSSGPSVTLSDRVSCYDVYPSPTIDTPAPCPVAEQSPGGGRTS